MGKYLKQLRKENPKFRLDQNMGIAIYQVLKGNKENRRWESLVDYTIKDLITHLERQFNEEMTWDNYGSYWHVDHIKPKSLFKYKYSDDPEFKKCWALRNLQPLERLMNIRKNNRFIIYL